MRLEVGKEYKLDCDVRDDYVEIIGKFIRSDGDVLFVGKSLNSSMSGIYYEEGTPVGPLNPCLSQMKHYSDNNITMYRCLKEVEEPAVEMTVDEICKELGKNIKIVKS